MKRISIVSAGQGWMLRSDAIDNEQFFQHGASAEAAALRLAQGLAEAGEGADVEIYTRRLPGAALRRAATSTPGGPGGRAAAARRAGGGGGQAGAGQSNRAATDRVGSDQEAACASRRRKR